MDRKDKACWNCLQYRAFYIKGWCTFRKQDCGLCKKQKAVVDKHELCEKWESNYGLRVSRKDATMHKLAELTDILVEIRQILLEEREEAPNDKK